MKKLMAVALLAIALVETPAVAQQQAARTRTRTYVETLASEKFDGRLTGSAGERLAADYISAELKRIGAKPLPGRDDYRLPFEFTAGSRDGGSVLTVNKNEFTNRADVRALSFSDNGTISGPIVFAGYGIVIPDGQEFGYDSYAGLDVKDKIVLVL